MSGQWTRNGAYGQVSYCYSSFAGLPTQGLIALAPGNNNNIIPNQETARTSLEHG